jgi:hypothetical protein
VYQGGKVEYGVEVVVVVWVWLGFRIDNCERRKKIWGLRSEVGVSEKWKVLPTADGMLLSKFSS